MADPTNPKDLIGVRKPRLGTLPAAGVIYGALAIQDSPYGPYNWREKKVLMSVYLDAIERHVMALRDGEDNTRDSKVPHLGSIIANAAILADAFEGGWLIDDRPPPGPAANMIEKYTKEKQDVGDIHPGVDNGNTKPRRGKLRG